MATDQAIIVPDEQRIFLLPVTGHRNGKKVVVGCCKVADDSFTHNVISTSRWNFHPNGYVIGTRKSPDGTWLRPLLHKFVYAHYFGPVPVGMDIDHIDRDKTNNAYWNLRALTKSFNNANIGRRRDNTSGFHGVTWCRNGKGHWHAQIKVNGKHISLGYFADQAEAAQTVNRGYQKYFPGIQLPNP